MKRAFFLDRDGVIIKSKLRDLVPRPPATVEEIEIIEGVAFSIQYLKANDFLPVVVTNQPDVARGITTEEKVNDIHEYLRIETSLEHFYTCFHDEQDKCLCRKPLTGLIDQAANDLNIDVSKSYLIGDRWRDIAAGNSAGCKTFFIDYEYPELPPKMPYRTVESLLEAVKIVVGETE